MVDAERLGRILARVRRDLVELRATAQERDLRADDVALRAVKYGFVTAIEGCVQAAQHILASEGLGMPESNADAVRLLGRHGIVDPDTGAAVAAAVGFRNVLVREYAEVDDDVVRANIALLDDLDAFIAAVAGWAAGQG